MPELPEVETIRRGLAPLLVGRTLLETRVRDARLRWPVPAGALAAATDGRVIREIGRRGKYLLLACGAGHLLIHLGMSGRLTWLAGPQPLRPHEHVIWRLEGGAEVRLSDPRRFGAVLWAEGDWRDHPLLAGMGPEPLEGDFCADYCLQRARGRRVAVKSWLMDGRMVAGVGNIYAAETLFRAGIHPGRPVGELARPHWQALVEAVRAVLREAIDQGGTTLRDYRRADGELGYFVQSLKVYGRADAPCPVCGESIRQCRIGQRSTCFCPHCQG
ncbi:MAG: bifunctional DNA-formamidopyrimidine glycosylase/DNA-(apurinic or apyrimidinic site) lyase [Magnetococcales bacterium]|nr:bifunctional DNA-formamidopyrimidine glycosylase/DNA-(apurinic or apyrimidinic site) lyase [Magnetococcales bacterium]